MPRSQSGEGTRDGDRQQANAQETAERGGANERRGRRDESTSRLFARAGLMTGLAVLGFVLLLFALGQAVGFDLLGLFADAISSQTGRWLVVAFFALLLIGVAERGIRGAWSRT